MKPYVVRKLRLGAIAPLLIIPLFFALPRLMGLDGFPLIFLAAFVALALWNAWQATLVLRVDGSGVVMLRRTPRRDRRDRTTVPWSSIHELVLSEGDPPEFAVRLNTGAPLPAGVRGVIHDPHRPATSVPELQVALPRADRASLTAAVNGRVPVRSA